MSDEKCYALPLAPQDLVSIYKIKENNEDFVLWVDYAKSKEKLSAKHIIIYLANTNFKTTFSAVDEDLILEYIKSDFMVDCSLLARIVVLILKQYYMYEVSEQEAQLFGMFDKQSIANFIEHNEDTIKELVDTIGGTVPFVMKKLYDEMPSDIQSKEENLKEYVDEIVVEDKPALCGPNIARLVTVGWDGFLLVLSRNGLATKYNKQVFNDSPKYFGKDLYYILCQTNMTNNILGFFPEDFINHDSTAK